jgi:hypothetical protein
LGDALWQDYWGRWLVFGGGLRVFGFGAEENKIVVFDKYIGL